MGHPTRQESIELAWVGPGVFSLPDACSHAHPTRLHSGHEDLGAGHICCFMLVEMGPQSAQALWARLG